MASPLTTMLLTIRDLDMFRVEGGSDGSDGEPLLTQLNIGGVLTFSLSTNKILHRIIMLVVSTVLLARFI